MPRINTGQPASARPEMVVIENLSTDWTTIAEAPDYSVPDAAQRWSNDRDPADDTRRIAPGMALIFTPIYAHNRDTSARWVEMQIVTEGGATVRLARVTISPGETRPITIAGITLTKTQIGTSSGDRLQMRAETEDVIDVTGTVNIGVAEQDQPA